MLNESMAKQSKPGYHNNNFCKKFVKGKRPDYNLL